MTSSLLKRIFIVLLGNGFSKTILLAFEFFLAIKLGAAKYGLFSVCFALLLLVSNLSLFGFNFGIIQYLSIYQEQQEENKVRCLIRLSLVIVSLIGLFVGITIFTEAQSLARNVFRKPELANGLMIVGLTIPFGALSQCMSAIFQGLRQFKAHVLVSQFVQNTCLLLSIPFILWFGFGLERILYFFLFGSILACVIGIFKLSDKLFFRSESHLKSWPILKELITFSYLLVILNLFQKLATRVQILLAGMFLTNEHVGILGVLLRLLLLFTFLQSAVNQTAPVEFARLNYLREKKALKHLFESIAQTLLIASTLIAIPIIVRPDVLLSIFGKTYTPYALLLLPLVCVQVVNVGTGPIGQLLVSCRKQSAILVSAFFATIVQFGLSLSLMPTYGLVGAVIAQSVTIGILTVIRHLLSLKLLRIHCFTWKFFTLIMIGVISSITGAYTARVEAGLFGWGLGIMTGMVCYLICLGIYSFLDKPFQKQAMTVLSMLMKISHDLVS